MIATNMAEIIACYPRFKFKPRFLIYKPKFIDLLCIWLAIHADNQPIGHSVNLLIFEGRIKCIILTD